MKPSEAVKAMESIVVVPLTIILIPILLPCYLIGIVLALMGDSIASGFNLVEGCTRREREKWAREG